MTDSTLKILDAAGEGKYLKGIGAGSLADPFVPVHARYKAENLKQTNLVSQYLLNGSAKNLGVDGTTPVTYSAIPASGKYWLISKLSIYLKDGSALLSDTFGNLTALTNGLSIKVAGVEIFNFKDNTDLLVSAGVVDFTGFSTVNQLLLSIDFGKIDAGYEGGLYVPETTGLTAVVQDNLSGLDALRIHAQGKIFTA